MNPKITELGLRGIEAFSSLTGRLLEQNRNYSAQAKEASDKRGGVLEKMLATGAIQPHQKSAAEAMLSSQAQTMDLLCSALEKMAAYKAAAEQANAELGRPVPTPAGRSEAPAQQKSAGVSFLGVAGQSSGEVSSVMASIMNDPRR